MKKFVLRWKTFSEICTSKKIKVLPRSDFLALFAGMTTDGAIRQFPWLLKSIFFTFPKYIVVFTLCSQNGYYVILNGKIQKRDLNFFWVETLRFYRYFDAVETSVATQSSLSQLIFPFVRNNEFRNYHWLTSFKLKNGYRTKQSYFCPGSFTCLPD